MPHIIRLRGPWEREPLPREGTARFTRRFHLPTGLDATSRIWLVIDEIDRTAQIVLNDRPLGCPSRFDITADLQPMNVLSITVATPTTGEDARPPNLIGLVQLEIE